MAKKEGKTVFVKMEAHKKLEKIKVIEQMSMEELIAKIIIDLYESDYSEIGEMMEKSKKM